MSELATANPFDARHEEYFEKRTAFKITDRLRGHQKASGHLAATEKTMSNLLRKNYYRHRTGSPRYRAKGRGGLDDSSNLGLLRPACHWQGHSSGFTFVLPPLPNKSGDGKFMHDMLLLEVKKPAESKAPWVLIFTNY
jgi:hypothetical protein